MDLLEMLTLEQLEVGMFRGETVAGSSTRSFGGSVAAQALVAAGRTVDGARVTHSLHGYFLRPGDSTQPVVYLVDAIRDGRSFTTRRVVAQQRGEAIFQLSASFEVVEEGLEHQVPVLHAKPPEQLIGIEDSGGPDVDPETREWLKVFRERFDVEVRIDGELSRTLAQRGLTGPPKQLLCMRSVDRLPDDPFIHQCAATYVSDLFLLGSALPPHNGEFAETGLMVASLDHAVWFHQPFRADEWLYYDQEGTWAGGGRALCRGYFFNTAGVLVATVMQEGLIRPIRP